MAEHLAPPWTATLPWPTTRLIGRATELARVLQLVREGRRLVTLTGTGGVGKTRLAIEAARALGDEVGGAVLVVWLGTLTDADGIAGEIARAAGWDVHDERSADEVVRARLAERPVVLLLDNCEQIDDIGEAVDGLVECCPHLSVLATSRLAFGIAAEQVVEVEPLTSADAVDVLVEAARRNDASFAVTDANRSALEQIAVRLDGLPLALHLAAARLHLVAPTEMLGLLDQRFRLLQGRAPAESPHHARLLTTIDWSYRLQSAEDRRRFRTLGAFPHTFTREAAATLTGCDPLDMLDTLTALVDHHLVRSMERTGPTARFGLLETLREFAVSELVAHDELTTARRAHARWCADLCRTLSPQLSDPAQVDAAMARLHAELDNLRAAFRWAARHDHELAREIGSVWRFWISTGLTAEAYELLSAALTGDLVATADAAAALGAAGTLADELGDLSDAEHWLAKAVEATAELGDPVALGRAQANLAHTERELGHLDTAAERYAAALGTARAIGDQRDEMVALNGIAAVGYRRGDLASAAAGWQAAHSVAAAIGDRRSELLIAGNVGVAAAGQGDFAGARSWYARAVEIGRDINEETLLQHALSNRAEASIEVGDLASGEADLDEAERLATRTGNRLTALTVERHRGLLAVRRGKLGEALDHYLRALVGAVADGRTFEAIDLVEYVTLIAEELGAHDAARRWLASARALRRVSGSAPTAPYAAALSDLAARLGTGDDTSFEPLELDDIVDELRELAARSAHAERTAVGPDALRELGLTAREAEVARLLAVRRTDPEIATELFIGVRTVATHVSAVLRKLGLRSRREVAARLADLDRTSLLGGR